MSSKPAAQQTARAETPAEATATGSETLEEFKESFAYGSRTDLLFKYLKRFSGEETGEFLHELITRLGETIDDGKVERLLEHVYEWNVRAYVEEVSASTPWDYAEGPFAPLSKPLSEVRLGLLTATGSYVEGDDPEPFGVKNMTQEEAIPRIVEFVKAEPQLAAIPWDTPRDKLRVRHPGYDIRAVRADPNVGLPLERLRELANQGVIKETLPDAYSFVGATAQIPLIKKHAPRWAEMLKEKGADAVLLVPLWPICHVSVGHAARAIEEAGIPTVIAMARAFRPRLEAMRAPRVLVTRHIMGRPLGAPNDVERQRAVILDALKLLAEANRNGAVVERPDAYRTAP